MAKVRRGLGKLGWALVALVMAAWVIVPLSALALDAVLVIAGLGASDVGGPAENGIPVESYSLSADSIVNQQAGAGGGVSATEFSDLRIVKQVDGTSPELMYRVAAQTLLTTATLYVGATSAKGGTAPASYDFSIELGDVIVTGIEASGGLNAPTETVKLNFGTITFENQTSGAEVMWNVLQNKGSLQ